MQRILCDGERGKVLILYGPLRSGKSTLCRNFLERYVHLPFWHVYYSFFQAVGQNEETILMEIAERISDAFYEQLGQMPRLWNTYNHLDPQTRFRQFIQGCLTQVPGSRLVLALDEFGGALESYEKETLEYRFFPYWKDLVDEIPQLSLILALPTSAHAQLSSAKFNNLFSFAESFSIEFLDRESAERLLTIPLKAQEIVMHPSAVSQTTTLTGCNPYYTALIGLHLFDYLNQETHKQHVTKEDITLIVSEIMKVGSNHNFNLYRQEIQNTDELQILRTFIDLTIVTQQSALSLKKLADTLSTQTNSIRPHMERLRNGLILQEENGESRNPRYAFRIELLRQWLTRNEWFFNK